MGRSRTARRPATTPPAKPAHHYAPTDPPTFREVADAIGWPAAADRINRWADAGYEGHYNDPRYAPQPHPGGVA